MSCFFPDKPVPNGTTNGKGQVSQVELQHFHLLFFISIMTGKPVPTTDPASWDLLHLIVH